MDKGDGSRPSAISSMTVSGVSTEYIIAGGMLSLDYKYSHNCVVKIFE